VVVAQDITERKQAEEALRASQTRTRLIIDAAHDPFIAMDAGGLIVEWNQQAEITFGWSPQEAIGRSLAETIIPPRYWEAHRRGLQHFLATGEGPVLNKRIEITALHRDGHEFPVELTIWPVRWEQSYIFNSFLHDITEKKQAEEALRLAKEEAERASHFKDQFLSTISHELRTPLNAVLGFSELLTDERYGPLTERQRRYIQHIQQGGRHLLKLISDILDLSKIEAGRLQLNIEEVSVPGAFAEVVAALRTLAEKKSQALFHYAHDELFVRADATRLKQILMNLVGNAVKFTPEGGRIEVVGRAAGAGVRVEVRDSGPGIPPQEQGRIFDAFYRIQHSGEPVEGTGLGLAISQRLVQLQGGELGLESEVGKGSCFYFLLPAARPARKAAGALAVPGPAARSRILVIEDDGAAATLIGSYLSAAGYDVQLCTRPERALEMVAEAQPHAITLDILMEPANGFEILAELKRDSRTAAIPVVVVSVLGERGMAVTLRADEYLMKPVEKSALLAGVGRCLERRGAGEAESPAVVLVVEDDSATREALCELLRENGYAVRAAADGGQARQWVRQALPELVILDLLLPGVSGFELLAEWRANARTADLPILILTGKDLSREEEKFLRAHSEFLLRKQEPWQEALIQQVRWVTAGRVEAG
jgi:PAS domain S-box-containing protein